ncbi:NAD(P)-binding protein [Zopfia rhizophila CBS 207.26]|uniref:NAD(P)-binding protein n=1 Tax=Zopfia rhizophila CBS 207.26 TaxID=1314779 RepID=A0A6A6E9Q5_9PEZI|nr:NAD(P)-binding protein [Zopfia rhizophila CBS 207.26]
MSKLVTVFGATGNQGASVIKHILTDAAVSKEFRIRGITRDVSKLAAQTLAKQGVEMKSADMNSRFSLADVIRGSHTVFLAASEYDIEVGVQYMIFSSLLHVTKTTSGRLTHVPHFNGKADIEEYIRESGLPATYYPPGYPMSNFIQMLRKEKDGFYTLAYPVEKDAKFPLIDIAEDTDEYSQCTGAIMKNHDRLLGARIYGAADYYTPERILAGLEEVTGEKTRPLQVSNEVYKSFLPDFMAEGMLENHLFIESPGYYNAASLNESHAI